MKTREILSDIKKLKKKLALFNKELPEKDDYGIVYCIISDTIRDLDELTNELPGALKDARNPETD